MTLISMKTDIERAETCAQNPYGYGLEIRLNEDQCAALGIIKPPTPGSKVQIRAMTLVTEVRQTMAADGDDAGPDTYLCLQITDLALGSTESQTVKASLLYDD